MEFNRPVFFTNSQLTQPIPDPSIHNLSKDARRFIRQNTCISSNFRTRCEKILFLNREISKNKKWNWGTELQPNKHLIYKIATATQSSIKRWKREKSESLTYEPNTEGVFRTVLMNMLHSVEQIKFKKNTEKISHNAVKIWNHTENQLVVFYIDFVQSKQI